MPRWRRSCRSQRSCRHSFHTARLRAQQRWTHRWSMYASHATRNIQPTAYSMKHATYNTQRTTCNIRHMTWNNTQCATCTTQHATRITQHTTRNIQHAACNTQHATRNMHPTQHGTCSVATQRCNMQRCRIRWTRSCRRFSATRPSARQYASPVVITSGLRGEHLTSVPSAVPCSTLQCSLVRGERPVPRSTDAVPHSSPVSAHSNAQYPVSTLSATVPAVRSVPLYP